VLRQELKHAATNRSSIQVKTAAERKLPCERVLIRALASANQIQASETRSSARDGRMRNSEPARQRNMRCNQSIFMRGWPRSH